MTLSKLKLKILMFRYGVKLNVMFGEVASGLISVRKTLRSYPDFISSVYSQTKEIALKLNAKTPKPKTSMEVNGEIGKNNG